MKSLSTLDAPAKRLAEPSEQALAKRILAIGGALEAMLNDTPELFTDEQQEHIRSALRILWPLTWKGDGDAPF